MANQVFGGTSARDSAQFGSTTPNSSTLVVIERWVFANSSGVSPLALARPCPAPFSGLE
jgi:hypothetical protein